MYALLEKMRNKCWIACCAAGKMFAVRYVKDVYAHRVTRRLIRNPNYGGSPSVVPGACIIPVIERKMKPKFFKALREDVRLHGFRNPILLYNTPEGLLLSFGGSRLRVAKELDVRIPAIVVDYAGDYVDCPEITPDNYQEFFRDVPVLFKFTDIGVDTHFSLERARREYYDPAGLAWTSNLDDTTFLDEEFPWLGGGKQVCQ